MFRVDKGPRSRSMPPGTPYPVDINSCSLFSVLNNLSLLTVVSASQTHYNQYMEHIFYKFSRFLSLLIRRIISVFHTLQVIMKKTNIIFFYNITKINLTAFSLQIPEAHFHPNLISIIPCSKGPNLPLFTPNLLKKCIISYRLFQKDCAQFHPRPLVYFPVLSTKTQKKYYKFHFISKIPDLRGQNSRVRGT
jgi:hypothetical protein